MSTKDYGVMVGQIWETAGGWRFRVVFVNEQFAVGVDPKRERFAAPDSYILTTFRYFTLVEDVPNSASGGTRGPGAVIISSR